MNTVKLSALALAISLTATLFVGPAYAEDSTLESRLVSFADLDLSHPAGMATLKHRIHTAALLVCGGGGDNIGAAGTADCARNADHTAWMSVLPALQAGR